MTRWMIVFLSVGFLALPTFAGEAGDGEKEAAETLEARIDRLVSQLGAEEWKERETATRDLVGIGKAALPALTKATQSKDPEVRVRARKAMDAIRAQAQAPAENGPSKKGVSPPPKAGPQPFPVPDPWNRDFAELIKKLMKDPFQRLPGMDPGADRDFEERMRRWRKEMDDWMNRDRKPGMGIDLEEILKALGGGRVPGLAHKSVIHREGETIEVGRDAGGKVTVVIRKKGDDGKAVEERHEAPSEDAFKKAHPEIYKKFVEGRFPRVRFLVNPGLDPWKDWRKNLGKDFERFGNLWDPKKRWKELEKSRKELEERLRRLRKGWNAPGRDRRVGAQRITVQRNGETIELERGGDGRIRLALRRRNEDGKLVEDRYEAASEEEFESKFPKVYEEHIRGRLGKSGLRIDWPSPFKDRPASLPRDRLGIAPGKVTDLIRAHLGIEEGVGFIVDEVAPGSLADKAGVRKWDLVLQAGGFPVSNPAEVLKALEEAKGPVELEVVRRGERTTLQLGK